MEVTRAVFARMCGVSKAAITNKIKEGTLLLNSAEMIETELAANRDYLTRHQAKQKEDIQKQSIALTKTTTPLKKSQTNGLIQEMAGIPEHMLNLTIKELVLQYGSATEIEKYAKILQLLMTSNEKDIKIKERRQIVISKDFVKARLFSYIDQLMNKLLDYPDSAVDVIIAKVKSSNDETRQLLISYIKDGLTRCICDAKEYIINELNGLKNKYDDSQVNTETIADIVADKINQEM